MDISVQFVEPPKKVWGSPHRLMPATFNLSASHPLSLLDSWLITKMGLWHQTHMNQRSCLWQVLLIISRRQVIKRHRVSMSQSRTVSAGSRPFLKALDWFWPRQYMRFLRNMCWSNHLHRSGPFEPWKLSILYSAGYIAYMTFQGDLPQKFADATFVY